MSDRIRATCAALVALALIFACHAPSAQAQDPKGTIEINVTKDAPFPEDGDIIVSRPGGPPLI